MSYEEIIIENIRRFIYALATHAMYRKCNTDFTRDRKMPFAKVVLYNLARKGLTNKMEIFNFDELVETADISSPAVLKQREKLNPEIYTEMMNMNNICFYNQFNDAKLFKGYILGASDGSDFEIPNTVSTRSKCGPTTVARGHVDSMFDLLNNFVLGVTFDYGKTDERAKAKEIWNAVKALNLRYPIISVRDRGYMSIKEVFQLNKNNDKYVIRFDEKNYKDTIKSMKSNDEIVEIKCRKDNVAKYKDSDPEYCKEMETNGFKVSCRVVTVELETGEKEYLATNLESDKFTYEDIKKIYTLRWGIETNFHTLKESLKIESISSSKEDLIKQDIYSQMVAFNTLQAFANAKEKEIDQPKYKHEMKININMAVGFFKKYFIYLLIEENMLKKKILMEELSDNIKRYLVPKRPGRKYPIQPNKRNKYPINKRKSF